MLRGLRCALLILMFVAPPLAAQSQETPPPQVNTEDLLRHAFRYPIAGVPLTDHAPSIDGDLGDDEWSGAALISDILFDTAGSPARNGCPLPQRCYVYLQYDNEALYVGYRYHLPQGTTPLGKGDPSKRDAVHGAGEDVIDMFFNPQAAWDVTEGFQIGGNSAGVMYDRDIRDPHGRWLWNPPSNQHATQPLAAGNGWTGEFKITFESLETKTPQPGDLWRANFANVRKTPMGIVAAWCFWNGWRGDGFFSDKAAPHYRREHGWLNFLGQPLAVRVTHSGNTAKFKPVTFDITGDIPAAGVNVEIQLYRRNVVPDPTDRGLVADLAEGVRLINVGGSAKWGQDFDDQIEYLLARTTPVGDPIRKTLKPGDDRTLALPHVTDEGEYAVSYRFTVGEGDGRMIAAAGLLPFRIEPDLIITLRPLVLELKKLRIEADMLNMPNANDIASLAVTSTDGSDRSVGQTNVPIDGGTTAVAYLDVSDWAVGDYAIRVEARDANGATLAAATSPFERVAEPQWWTNKAGMTPAVPEPFTPVKVGDDGKTVEVVLRKYTFTDSAIPSSIIATPNPWSKHDNPQPIELLAQPMRWRVGDVKWQTTAFEVVEREPTHVILRSVQAAGGMELETTTKIEFDGMLFVTLSLTGDASIESLELPIVLRREVAHLMAKSFAAPGPGSGKCGGEGSGGRYPDISGEVVYHDAPWAGQFLFCDEVGLEISMESTRGWRMRKADQAMVTRVDSDTVTETLRLVSMATNLAETPVRIELGMIAAPIKPRRADWGTHRYLQEYGPWLPGATYPRNKDKPAYTEADLEQWKRWHQFTGADHLGEFFPQQRMDRQWNILPVEDPYWRETIRKRYALAKSLGVGCIPHAGWFSVYIDLPVYEHFGYEMLKFPPEITIDGSMAATMNTPWTDWYTWNVQREAQTLGSHGLRYDTMNLPIACYSEDHDNVWFDQYGTKHPTIRHWSSRDYLSRNYRTFHGGVIDDGYVDITNAKYPPICQMAFGDMYEVGEGPFERAPTLKDGYPPLLVRSLMTHGQFGFRCIVNMKGSPLSPNERLAALLVHGAEHRATHRPHVYYEGYQITRARSVNTIRIWDAYDWVGRGTDAMWKPYWRNGKTLTVRTPGDEEVYASYYVDPGKKILLIIANYEREPVADVAVKFDLGLLGFSSSQKLHAVDAVTQMPVAMDGDTATLGIFAQRWRMVRISTERSRYDADNLGPDRLAWGGFESALDENFALKQFAGQDAPAVAVDSDTARTGSASLSIDKKVADYRADMNFTSPPVAVEAGDYVLTGYIRRTEPLPTVDEIGFDRYAKSADLHIGIAGAAVDFDPPLEFSNVTYVGGDYIIKETTPGWQPFSIKFKAAASTGSVKVTARMRGGDGQVGRAWLDDLQLRRVKK